MTEISDSGGTGVSGAHAPPYDDARAGGGLSPWQFFLLLSMLGATAAVIVARDTQPAALLLISAAVISAGLVAIALFQAFSALFGRGGRVAPPSGRTRALLEADKALVLRSIKELEFDRAMGKVSESDFAEIGGRLRARALSIMQQLEAAPVVAPAAPHVQPRRTQPTDRPAKVTCASCSTTNDGDARFCKQCGSPLERVHA